MHMFVVKNGNIVNTVLRTCMWTKYYWIVNRNYIYIPLIIIVKENEIERKNT